jgi:hypothetical protein
MKRLYLLLFAFMLLSAYSYGQKKILYVGRSAQGTYYADYDQFDSLAAWGYLPEYIQSTDFKNGDLTMYDGYDGVFISETVSSGDVTAFGTTHAFPLPCVNMEGYAPRVDRWNWLTDNTTQFFQTPDGTGSEDDEVIVIKDNTHYITKIFNVDDEIPWSSATGIDMQQNEPTSWKEVNVTYTYKLAQEKAHISNYPDFWTMIAIDPTETIPNKLFMWGMNAVGLCGDNQTQNLGTPEYFKIMKRACDWAFDEMETTSVPDHLSQSALELVAFPVPSSDQVTIRFNALNPLPARVALYNVAGQQMEILYEKNAVAGNNFVILDAKKYAPGLYYVRLEIEGRTEFAKIIIN